MHIFQIILKNSLSTTPPTSYQSPDSLYSKLLFFLSLSRKNKNKIKKNKKQGENKQNNNLNKQQQQKDQETTQSFSSHIPIPAPLPSSHPPSTTFPSPHPHLLHRGSRVRPFPVSLLSLSHPFFRLFQIIMLGILLNKFPCSVNVPPLGIFSSNGNQCGKLSES